MNCYIHVPFCAAKCGYCAFYSEAGAGSELIEAYLRRLEQDLSADIVHCETVYVGGGTPTYLDCSQLERLCKLIHRYLPSDENTELSIEANPESLTEEKVALLRQYFTRLSMGVQSFDAMSRERIGRRCSQKKLLDALDLVRRAGFPHWNCDLIYSLPGQTAAMWEQDLRMAAECGADHISCYALTPEENSRLGATFDEDDERETEFYQLAEQVLSGYGIHRYEISNYARRGCGCRHNLNVWRGGLLRGYGPAAAGFDGFIRRIEVESLNGWLNGAPPEVDEIPLPERLNEIFAVNLRTVDGWDEAAWQRVENSDRWENRLKIAEKLQKSFPGQVSTSGGRIKLTPEGLLFWNTIAQEIIYGD